MTDDVSFVEIRLTPEFQRKLRALSKKYRQVRADLQPILEQLQIRSFLGDQIPGIGFTVMKVRLKNSDNRKGKSGGYRLIYWTASTDLIVLLDIYSKSDQSNVEVDEIRQIIKRVSFNSGEVNDWSILISYSYYPKPLELLRDRVDNDPDEQLRQWAGEQLKNVKLKIEEEEQLKI